ncbi:uncharacterized protein LOC116605416 [Nematostella vectensis]|uniref:uncharacterized protein LOC116605416 n=1 Tax=Nematostella vectensis TaxID=45351 RepID=UPI002076E587|nr:uncharacterized protein LOC116605416 [Nematostella vectensis]
MLRRAFVNLGFNSPSEAEKALKKSNRKDDSTRAQKGRLLNRSQMEKIRALPPPGEVKRQEVLDATPALPPASAQRTMGLPSQAATAEDNRRLGVQVLRVVKGGVAPTGLPRPTGKSRFSFARKKAKATDAKSTLPDIRDTNDNALVNMRTTDLPNVRDLYTNKKDNAVPVASEGASATTPITGSHQAMTAMQSEEEPGASMGHRTERQKAKELKQMKRAGLTPLRPPPHRNTMEDDADHKARMNKLKRARIRLAKNRVNPEVSKPFLKSLPDATPGAVWCENYAVLPPIESAPPRTGIYSRHLQSTPPQANTHRGTLGYNTSITHDLVIKDVETDE